ncbi:MAG: glycosyltransferase family 2 protein [Chloroflexi bacterium]|nr:MAG: glycosyltransferase family 2 protein [Chloroflexota bacterium]
MLNENFSLLTLSIVSHGDTEKIQELLASLRQHESPQEIQLLITDNLGDDLPDLPPASWASLTILRNKKKMGFAHNHNQAFRHATGEYFCVLNPDILFTETIFPHLIDRLERKAAIISPLIFDSADTLQDSFRQFPTPAELLRRKLPGYRFTPLLPDEQGLIHPDWLAGMFLLMRRKSYKKLGGFDEKYYLYFEDVDFCARARDLNLLPLVDTNLQVQHNAQRASRKQIRYLLWHLQSAIRFFRSPVYQEIG